MRCVFGVTIRPEQWLRPPPTLRGIPVLEGCFQKAVFKQVRQRYQQYSKNVKGRYGCWRSMRCGGMRSQYPYLDYFPKNDLSINGKQTLANGSDNHLIMVSESIRHYLESRRRMIIHTSNPATLWTPASSRREQTPFLRPSPRSCRARQPLKLLLPVQSACLLESAQQSCR